MQDQYLSAPSDLICYFNDLKKRFNYESGNFAHFSKLSHAKETFLWDNLMAFGPWGVSRGKGNLPDSNKYVLNAFPCYRIRMLK